MLSTKTDLTGKVKISTGFFGNSNYPFVYTRLCTISTESKKVGFPALMSLQISLKLLSIMRFRNCQWWILSKQLLQYGFPHP
jgi:hypothetical protein